MPTRLQGLALTVSAALGTRSRSSNLILELSTPQDRAKMAEMFKRLERGLRKWYR